MEYQAKGNWKILEKWNRQNKCHHDDISNLYFAPYEQNINCKDHVIKTRRNRHQYGQKVTMTTFRTGTSWDGESWPDPAPQGDTTTWAYDAATGLVTSKLYADGYGPSYAYTTSGRLATRTWARKDSQGNDLATN